MDQLVRALRAASRLIPRASCLCKALVLQALLIRRGMSSTVAIGVAKREDGKLKAHAWVELDGKVVLGGITARSFTPIHYLTGD